MKPVSAYMEAEELQIKTASSGQKESCQEEHTLGLLAAIKNISQEFGKIETNS